MLSSKTPLSKLSVLSESAKNYEYQAYHLFAELSKNTKKIVGYEDYTEQTKLKYYIGKTISDADKTLKAFMEKYDVNVSNNYGLTLLHQLVWHDRADLIKILLDNPKFQKINYKFCIPVELSTMYASALDLAITKWLDNEIGFDFNLIELLLKNGAFTPKPNKKFLNTEMVAIFYPLMILTKSEIISLAAKEGKEEEFKNASGPRSPDEIIQMFCLLNRYGFSIDALEKEFESRLFDTDNCAQEFESRLFDTDNCAQEFESVYSINITDQKFRFEKFMKKLKEMAANNTPGQVIVEMNETRKDNGESTLDLPFDLYSTCRIM